MSHTPKSPDEEPESENRDESASDFSMNDLDLLKDMAKDYAGPKLEAGMVFGSDRRFTLLSPLGQGGTSWVWLAKDEILQTQVALKIFKPHALADAGGAARLLREIDAVQRVDHPHIAKVLDLRDKEKHPFFVMEWIQGTTLRELIDQHVFYWASDRSTQALKRQRYAAEILAKIANALHHTHQRRIIHRDVKPGNILVEVDGEQLGKPYLTDFGLCKSTDTKPSDATEQGKVPGTAGYYAPERILKPEDVTTSWDIWGLGVVLYELLTGRLPFQGATDFEVKTATLKGSYILPDKLNPHADRDLVAICFKCLRKNPEKRYQSAREVGDDLKHWLEGRTVSARAQSFWERAWEWMHRNPMAAALAMSILLGPTITALSYVLIMPYMTNTHAVRKFQNGVLELEVLTQKNERCSFNIRKESLNEQGGRWAVMYLQGDTNGLPPHLLFCLMGDQGGLPDPVRSDPIIPGVPFKVRPGALLGEYLDRYYYLAGLNFDPKSYFTGRTHLKATIIITNSPQSIRSATLADTGKSHR